MSYHNTKIMTSYKFWFYVRKAVFQGVIPILTTIITFYDLAHITNNVGKVFNNIYIYSTSILFFYGLINTVNTFISNTCGTDVVFKRDFNEDADQQIENAMFSASETIGERPIVVIKRIFKLKYSGSYFFIFVSKFCWMIGMDCPILIPKYIVDRAGVAARTANMSEKYMAQSCVDRMFNMNSVQGSNYRLMVDENDLKLTRDFNHIKSVIFCD